MDSTYRALANRRVWGPYGSSNATRLEVTELSLDISANKIRTQHSTVAVSDLSAWLRNDQARAIDGKDYTVVFRVVWAERTKETMKMNLPKGAFSDILDAFDLHLANQYCASYFAGVSELPRKQSKSTATDQRHFTFSYHPKLAVIWSHTTGNPPSAALSSTDVILFLDASQMVSLKALLNIDWDARVAMLPMFPLLLCNLLLSQEVHTIQDSIKIDVREVEVRTGYHRFGTRREQPATGELGDLSARMSGCETKLASVTRKLKTVEDSCRFMMEKSPTEDCLCTDDRRPSLDTARGLPVDESELSGAEILQQSVQLLQGRIKMQIVDNEYILQRVRIQISALFNLISQHDTVISLKIAQASQLSAMTSQHDSSSMKTLAIVTMLFLPGSFVSSLFSIDFFDWDGGDSSSPISFALKPGFGLYWAVAVPLTVMIFFVYALWTLFYRWKQNRMNKDIKWHFPQPTALEEVRILSMRREILYEK